MTSDCHRPGCGHTWHSHDTWSGFAAAAHHRCALCGCRGWRRHRWLPW